MMKKMNLMVDLERRSSPRHLSQADGLPVKSISKNWERFSVKINLGKAPIFISSFCYLHCNNSQLKSVNWSETTKTIPCSAAEINFKTTT